MAYAVTGSQARAWRIPLCSTHIDSTNLSRFGAGQSRQGDSASVQKRLDSLCLGFSINHSSPSSSPLCVLRTLPSSSAMAAARPRAAKAAAGRNSRTKYQNNKKRPIYTNEGLELRHAAESESDSPSLKSPPTLPHTAEKATGATQGRESFSVSSQGEDSRSNLSQFEVKDNKWGLEVGEVRGEGGSEVRGGGRGATRGEVFLACVLTSATMSGVGIILRQASSWASDGGWSGGDGGIHIHNCNLLMPLEFNLDHLGIACVVAGVVSIARLLLLRSSSDFSSESETANAQILTNLGPLDLIWVASLPAISEELLFRGAVLPLVGVNWGGIIVAGSVFGALHMNGGRNTTFAIWAAAVGVLYGYLSVATSDLSSPIFAHALANLAGACAWKFGKLDDQKLP